MLTRNQASSVYLAIYATIYKGSINKRLCRRRQNGGRVNIVHSPRLLDASFQPAA